MWQAGCWVQISATTSFASKTWIARKKACLCEMRIRILGTERAKNRVTFGARQQFCGPSNSLCAKRGSGCSITNGATTTRHINLETPTRNKRVASWFYYARRTAAVGAVANNEIIGAARLVKAACDFNSARRRPHSRVLYRRSSY
jgi:hypothetical protein